ncbi:MAG: 30S ribosomal protein S8 [Magnetococcales bacterium]|nr:30S ribosomal protein S8 [Magnetococcales bacterium]
MGMTDPVADMLTRIRNGQRVRKETVDVPASKLKEMVAKILLEEGYIAECATFGEGPGKMLRITLKYHRNRPVIEEIRTCSRPGRRLYVNKTEIPRVFQGMGIAILSTSKGVLSSRRARKEGIGGELLCTVF